MRDVCHCAPLSPALDISIVAVRRRVPYAAGAAAVVASVAVGAVALVAAWGQLIPG